MNEISCVIFKNHEISNEKNKVRKEFYEISGQ